jgi:hypothetical protein
MSAAETKRAARHWLLPHERWLGRFTDRVKDPPPGGKRWAFKQNYGPEGDVFYAAIAADVIAAVALLFAGVILLGVSGSVGPLAAAGYWLMGIAFLLGLVGIVGGVQGIHAGRAFRAGRPYIRPGRR